MQTVNPASLFAFFFFLNLYLFTLRKSCFFYIANNIYSHTVTHPLVLPQLQNTIFHSTFDVGLQPRVQPTSANGHPLCLCRGVTFSSCLVLFIHYHRHPI